MSGIHSSRLAASKAHRQFVDSTRRSIRRLGWELPNSAEISPTIVGAQPLPFAVPPGLERALGYRGKLRFVQFGFVPNSRQFAYCDGGDDVPSDKSLWIWFLKHPLISPHLPESRYPTLYGVFPHNGERPTLEKIFGEGEDYQAHCLLLDRQVRKAYVSERDQSMILFAAVEPESGDHHTVFVDGLLMSPGTEDYKTPPPAELVDQFRGFLDHELEIARNV